MRPAREGIKAEGAVAYALALSVKSYAIYFHGKTQNASLDLPPGSYRANWVNVLQGNIEKTEDFTPAGGDKSLAATDFREDIALKVESTAVPR